MRAEPREPPRHDDEDGEHATLTFRRVYRHAIEHVWDAIATPEGLRGWLMAPRRGSRAAPAAHRDGVGTRGTTRPGRILAWEPPRLLEYEWNVAPVPEMPRGERAIFRYELDADGESRGSRDYRRITLANGARISCPVLHAFLDRLEAQLDGRAAARLVRSGSRAHAPSIPSGGPCGRRQENDVFHAIAHPARRAILVTLKDGERAASELAGAVRDDVRGGLAAPARARGGGARRARRDGRQRLYRLQPQAAPRCRRAGSTSSRRTSASGSTRSASTSTASTGRSRGEGGDAKCGRGS